MLSTFIFFLALASTVLLILKAILSILHIVVNKKHVDFELHLYMLVCGAWSLLYYLSH